MGDGGVGAYSVTRTVLMSLPDVRDYRTFCTRFASEIHAQKFLR